MSLDVQSADIKRISFSWWLFITPNWHLTTCQAPVYLSICHSSIFSMINSSTATITGTHGKPFIAYLLFHIVAHTTPVPTI